MTNLLKNKRGVTLVELLAVIIILGIIAAIAVPTIGNLIDNQKQNAAETQWANIVEAARLYSINNAEATSVTLAALDPTYISLTGITFAIDDDAVIDNEGDTTLPIPGTADISFTLGGAAPVLVIDETGYDYLFVNGRLVVQP